VKVTLLAFAALRRAAAPLLPSAGTGCTAPCSTACLQVHRATFLLAWHSAVNPPLATAAIDQ